MVSISRINQCCTAPKQNSQTPQRSHAIDRHRDRARQCGKDNLSARRRRSSEWRSSFVVVTHMSSMFVIDVNEFKPPSILVRSKLLLIRILEVKKTNETKFAAEHALHTHIDVSAVACAMCVGRTPACTRVLHCNACTCTCPLQVSKSRRLTTNRTVISGSGGCRFAWAASSSSTP